MSKLTKIPGFGGSDPTDSRKFLDWESRYPVEARASIRFEAWYLAILLFACPCLLFAFNCEKPTWLWQHVDVAMQPAVSRYGLAWISGMLGGSLFAIKWLYHVVARGLWNLDRRLWRLFTSHISGGLAFAVIVLITSGILKIFDAAAVQRPSVIVGIGFLVGYFSDSAIAKLTEVAETLFGTTRSKEEHVPNFARAEMDKDNVLPPDTNAGAGGSS